MKCIKNKLNVQSSVSKIFERLPILKDILKKLKANKAQSYLVGGAVRDIILDKPVKDIDIEIHDISLKNLEILLNQFGHVRLAGKTFGVLKIDGLPIDWSLPRTDASGRKPEVALNPEMDITQALKRRDLTMNAIALNLNNYEIIDPFDGCQDIKDKVLRTPDAEFFAKDPLRFYRVMQFISRFAMYPDRELNDICSRIDISTVSKERISEEFDKMLLKSEKPSLGIRWLNDIGRLKEILPELANTRNVEQEPEWHPEGDVFEHSMQALDAAASYNYKDNEEKLIILYAALSHDLGKVSTTKMIKGRIRSHGHDIAGEPLARKMLNRITNRKKLIDTVATLVRWHMQPKALVKLNSRLAAYKRLAKRLAFHGATIEMLSLLSQADSQGRNAKKYEPLTEKNEQVEEFIKRAQQAGVFKAPVKPLLTGKDILEYIKPGPLLGELLDYAYKQQIENDITDKEVLKKLVLKKLKK